MRTTKELFENKLLLYPGFYRVRLYRYWIVAYWDGTHFTISGSSRRYPSVEIDEINTERILMPDEKEDNGSIIH